MRNLWRGMGKVAALVLAVMVTSLALVPRQALADTGSIVITNSAGDNRTYSAWLLATADMGEGGRASDLAWTGNDMRDAVVGFISQPVSATGAMTSYASWMSAKGIPSSSSQLPGCALSYAGAMASASDGAGVTFSKGLAAHVAGEMGAPTGTTSTGVDLAGSTGYWLIAETDANGIMGVATPMLVPMTTGRTSVVDKSPARPSSAPTLAKHAIDPSTGSAVSTVDARVGETVTFSIESRLPGGIADLSAYHMRFVDTMSEGLSLAGGNTGSVSVKVGATDVTSRLTGAAGSIALTGNVLTVDIANLVGLVGGEMALTSDTVVSVRYDAVLGTGCVIGAAGNPNSVQLTYTMVTGEETTSPVTARVASYELEISKSDSKGGKPLAGAGFVIRAVNGGTAGDYVQADGTLSPDEHEFVTGSDGKVSAPGIGTGTYQVTEVTVPEGYVGDSSPISIAISATHPIEGMGNSGLSLTVSGRNATAGTSDAEAGVIRLHITNKSETDDEVERQDEDDEDKEEGENPTDDQGEKPDDKKDDAPSVMGDLAKDVRDTAGKIVDDISRGDLGSLVQTGVGFIGRWPIFGVLAVVAAGSLVASVILRRRGGDAVAGDGGDKDTDAESDA